MKWKVFVSLLFLSALLGCAPVEVKEGAVSNVLTPDAAQKLFKDAAESLGQTGLISPEAAANLIKPGDLAGAVKAAGKIDFGIWGHFLENLLKNVSIATSENISGTQVTTTQPIEFRPNIEVRVLDMATVAAVVAGFMGGIVLVLYLLYRNKKVGKQLALTDRALTVAVDDLTSIPTMRKISKDEAISRRAADESRKVIQLIEDRWCSLGKGDQ